METAITTLGLVEWTQKHPQNFADSRVKMQGSFIGWVKSLQNCVLFCYLFKDLQASKLVKSLQIFYRYRSPPHLKGKQVRNRHFVLLFSALICINCSAQAFAGENDVMRQFIENHPQARFYGANFHTRDGIQDEMGTSTMIYGTALSVGSTPLESAWNHIHEVQGLLGNEFGVLMPDAGPEGNVMLGAMYNRATDTYKFSTFRFNQVYNDIPVFRSGAGILVRNETGNPLVLSTFDVKDLTGLDVRVAGLPGAQKVTPEMIRNVNAMMDTKPVLRSVLHPVRIPDPVITEEEFMIWAGTNNLAAQPALAMKFVATRGSELTNPEIFQRYLVLASVATGEILYSETMVHEFTDVTGTVSGRATQGLNALECDPEVAIPLPYIEANVVGGNTVFADANGQFVIPHGGTAPVTVRSRLRGQYFEVYDDTTGQTIPEVTTSVTPPGPANLLHNPTANQEFPTANVNAYVEANRVRDFTLSYAPNYPTIANQNFFRLVANENSFSGITSCNAVYTGTSLVFWRNSGGCNNTSFSDVVHHEYGHHLIEVTGNGQGQLGEGSGDCMGVLIQDDPILGQGFVNCGQGIRNANNNLQYPQTGEIHDAGQLISGCVWSLRNQLIVTEPSSYRDIGASLFINMMIVRGQMLPGNSTISPEITIIYLELDDDDANIGNGTPHYQEIATAFGAHNMDAPPLELLDFSFPDGRPELVDPAGGVVEFRVEAIGLGGTPQPNTGVLHLDRGNGIETFNMSQESNNVYEVVFPAIDCGTNFSYYFSAQTTGNQTEYSPTDAPDVRYNAISATGLTTTFEDNFQSNQGWSVSGNATDGQWSRGVPIGGGDRGDPPTDADGSGQCYLTDNVDGNSDVDGGSTILTSPILDADPGAQGDALISYYRWYSNDNGGNPFADIFVVDISNDGGSTWTNLETVGPSGPEVSGGWFHKTFRIGDFVTPTSNMRIRFNASDLGAGSIVEAGVDGVTIQIVDCDQGDPPATVPADSLTVFRGQLVGGTLADAADSDNVYMLFRPGITLNTSEAPLWLIFNGTLPSDNPNTLDLVMESQAGTPGLTATLEVWNWNTSAYDVVDVSPTSFNSDAVVTVDLTSGISNYVQSGTGAVRTRAGWRLTGLALVYPWIVSLDQIVWNVNQ